MIPMVLGLRKLVRKTSMQAAAIVIAQRTGSTPVASMNVVRNFRTASRKIVTSLWPKIIRTFQVKIDSLESISNIH